MPNFVRALFQVSGWRRTWPILALVPFLVVPLFLRDSVILDVAATWMLAALIVVGWTTFCGPAQEVSLGHALFFGGAGYVAAILQVRAGAAPLVALTVAVGSSAALGGLLALLTARHRGLYFSMVTMAVQIAAFRVLFLRGDIFGGEEGLTGIRAAIVGRSELYAAVAALLLIATVGAVWFLRSRTGLLLGAVGQHETLARSLGAKLTTLRAAGLVSAAVIAGAGGAAWALTQGYVNPDLAGEELSARAALLGCIGGLWSPIGAIVASIGWDGFRFTLSRMTDLAGPISTTLLLGLVARPFRRSAQVRPTWDDLQLPPPSVNRRAAPDPGAAGLVLRDISVRFGGLHPLKGISFSLPCGRAMGLIGPNGAGKTTLLNAVAGLVPSSGEIHWGDKRLTRLDTAARARCGVRKTFQHPARFPDFSPWEHLQVAVATSSAAPIDGPALRTLLAMCEPVRGRRSSELDSGTMRFVEMAMALVAPPGVLLLDEPYAGLSAHQADAISGAIGELKAAGVTLLIVEHRLADMMRTVDDLVVISEGYVLKAGPVADVLADPQVKRAYLGT